MQFYLVSRRIFEATIQPVKVVLIRHNNSATKSQSKDTKVLKIPNLKHQITNKFQITIPKSQIISKTNCLEF